MNDENDDFENSGKGTRGTVLLIDKDADRENDENDENEDTLNNKNVSTAYAQKIIDRDTKWLYNEMRGVSDPLVRVIRVAGAV